jgi:hypothetical protein
MSNKHVDKSSRVPPAFEEKSAWIQLLSLIVVLGGYFVVAGRMMAAGVDVLAAYVGVFAVSVVLLVAVMVVGYTAVAIASRPDGRDERDRIIEWRAESQSGWLLGTGVIGGITALVLQWPAVWVAHLLLFSLFAAELLKLLLQIAAYRRGF